jgi:lipoate-protein ligase A
VPVHGLRLGSGLIPLQSDEWTYLQTPQFTCKSDGPGADAPAIDMTVRYGAIIEGAIKFEGSSFGQSLVGKRVHEIEDWSSVLPRPDGVQEQKQWQSAAKWLGKVFGRV